jgi:sialidase-1
VDTILLAKGFYVAYLSFDNQYGSPAAMQIWDNFYNYLTDTLHLATKVCLEDVSRGALYALAWAKRNPDKVTCIYSETPVYDFKSWPGGKEKSPGDTAAWRQLKQIFHFTEEQAIAYKDNPVDNLAGLAAFKVPVFNVIGIHDKLAPYADNTGLFVERYTAVGGPVAVYPVTEGPEELQGHHFPLKHAQQYADFIYGNTYPVKNIIPYTDYIKIRGGLANFYYAAMINKKATVAFLGGSLTHNPGWRDMVCNYLKERFPETDFHFIAAGIPSLGSLPHTFRLQQDVLDTGKIDLMFIEAAGNDRVNATDSLTQVRSLEGIVRHARKSNPMMDMILVEFAVPDVFGYYDKGITPAEITNHELVASHYALPSANISKEVYDKIKNHELNWKDDFKDVHPAPYGQELYFESLKKMLEMCLKYKSPVAAKNYKMPPLLDKNSFLNGSYYDIKNAKTDVSWTIDPKWHPATRLELRPGFFDVPVLSSSTPGAMLKLPFKGNAIGIAVASGPESGIISYSIDNAPYKEIDLYTYASNALYLPWYILLGDGLHNGNHTLIIKLTGKKNKKSEGTACHIVHFFKND